MTGYFVERRKQSFQAKPINVGAKSDTPTPGLFTIPYALRNDYQILFSERRSDRCGQETEFSRRVLDHIEKLDKHPCKDLICREALAVGNHHRKLLVPYLAAAADLPKDESFIIKWVKIAIDTAVRNIQVCRTFLEYSPKAIVTFGPHDGLRWGTNALNLLIKNGHLGNLANAYLSQALKDADAVPLHRWHFFLAQSRRISVISVLAAEAFIQFGVRICRNLDNHEIEKWAAEGLKTYATSNSLVRYFNGMDANAFTKRNEMRSSEPLKDRINLLSMICEANLGMPVRIQSNASIAEVAGFSGGSATDGCIVYLPETADDFGMFKLMALHQSMLIHHPAWPVSGSSSLDSVQIHVDTDQKLLKRMPGLKNDMNRLMPGKLPSSYPLEVNKDFLGPLPWWGDILPDLACQSQETIQEIQEKASDYINCSPDAVEGFVAGMMARGRRSTDGLWERLRLMFNTSDFGSPEAECLPDDVGTFQYPEWDKDISAYKKNWCLVREKPAPTDPNGFVREVRAKYHGLISLVRRQFLRFKPEQFRRFRAQAFGDQLDIDALVQSIVDKRAGSFLSENVYIRRDKLLRDVAVLFLVDISESTEEPVNGRRVIDIQKEALVLMAEALDSLNDPYALYGFNSDGRFRVNMLSIKEFNESNDDQVKYRIGNLAPGGLTRLGAAVRHGITKLDTIRARVKLMVILTDGRPYDLDYGDMDYAVNDTKKAIQEARKLKIHPFIITSDQEGAGYLKQITPITHSMILPKVELLPSILPAIYKRLTV
jgi:von Willebrand factor type A domain-containing protein